MQLCVGRSSSNFWTIPLGLESLPEQEQRACLQSDVASEAVLAQPPPDAIHHNRAQILLLRTLHPPSHVCETETDFS